MLKATGFSTVIVIPNNLDPDDLVTEGDVGQDESVEESVADIAATSGTIHETLAPVYMRYLSPACKRAINVMYSLVIVILLAHTFEIFWLAGRYLPNSSKMPPFDTEKPSITYVALYTTMLVPWIFHYWDMLRDGKDRGGVPRNALAYQAGPPSTRIKAFWIIALLLYSIELAHDLVFMKHTAAVPADSAYTFSTGFIISLAVRLTITVALLVTSIAVDVHVQHLLSRDPHMRDTESGRPTSATPIPDLYKPPTSFGEFGTHFHKLLPFMWPRGKHSLRLKLMIIGCFILLVLGRVVNLLVPLQYKEVVEALGGAMGFGFRKGDVHLEVAPEKVPYGSILVFVLLRFLSGGVGLLSTLQSYLWIPVGQYTTREISVKMFEHLHNLSLRFHLNRKTGEILRVQDRGVASIVSLFSAILFNIIPTLADIAIACFYFTIEFDMYFGLIVFATMGLYIFSTIVVTEWRTKYRRIANLLDNAMEAKAVDSLLNFETVKYYNAEDFEVQQYTNAVKEYQKADFVSSLSLSLLNMTQNVIIQVGLLVGCILCAKRIVYDKTMTVGDFVLYLSYITQLYGPLNWFGNYYRVIQKNFVDMEKMLDLFKEPIEIQDTEDPKPLVVKGGEVVFENVSFAYDPRRPVLEDVSFRAEAGSTIALVGPSGSGKSTILRLLFRFYDIHQGSIRIDGVDIRDVRQKQLRGQIGVVPQDTVLFNDTIKYNLMYGRPSASDHEVFVTAEASQIHDRILSFPDGYETKVGERGLRLSGGEKQRVAIARTLLKNPSIILLDEATSALDTRSEAALQSALLTRSRTTIVIAHRLSTIVNADQILVLKDGRIFERGTHETLMRMRDGIYYDMWMKQLKDEQGLGGLAHSSLDHWLTETSSVEEMKEPEDDQSRNEYSEPTRKVVFEGLDPQIIRDINHNRIHLEVPGGDDGVATDGARTPSTSADATETIPTTIPGAVTDFTPDLSPDTVHVPQQHSEPPARNHNHNTSFHPRVVEIDTVATQIEGNGTGDLLRNGVSHEENSTPSRNSVASQESASAGSKGKKKKKKGKKK
ncbi:hypothetical protein DFS34DRAFT_664554 [Phlyctochytrium arcticum]|nr:hypothetical protein DFS34DRAFT_664554 [Phlyctochytrium arcticum]